MREAAVRMRLVPEPHVPIRLKTRAIHFFRFRGMHVDKSYLVREDQATAGPPNEQNHRDGMRAQDISTIGTEIFLDRYQPEAHGGAT